MSTPTSPVPTRHAAPEKAPEKAPDRPRRAGHRAEDRTPDRAADRADRHAGPDGVVDDDLDGDLDEALSPRLERGIGLVLLIGGLVGAVVALVLLVEKISSLQNANYVPSCSIDPVLSCGTIMKTAQASVLGFPNPAIGLLTFPVVAACGALVCSRVELPRWTWLALQFGAAAGIAFIGWLIVQSLDVIHALCPYCMVAWAAVTAIFWYVTVHNLAVGHLDLGRVGDVLVRRHGWVLAAFYVVIIAAVLATFPAYFAGKVGF